METRADVTGIMVVEHKLILRMINVLEKKCAEVGAGGFSDWDFFLEAVDFIRNYADRFHHGKEEEVLFKELVANGMPADNSPVGAMLITHEEGRGFVRGMEEATVAAKLGDPDAPGKVVENGTAYARLLRNHIEIEDTVLYPLAERVLPAIRREEMRRCYRDQEAASPEVTARYTALVEKYE